MFGLRVPQSSANSICWSGMSLWLLEFEAALELFLGRSCFSYFKFPWSVRFWIIGVTVSAGYCTKSLIISDIVMRTAVSLSWTGSLYR